MQGNPICKQIAWEDDAALLCAWREARTLARTLTLTLTLTLTQAQLLEMIDAAEHEWEDWHGPHE